MADPRTFVGRGKIGEIRNYIKEKNIDLAIFDDELSPAQFRNIEKELECRIIDRNNLILDIFARRAQTSYARPSGAGPVRIPASATDTAVDAP